MNENELTPPVSLPKPAPACLDLETGVTPCPRLQWVLQEDTALTRTSSSPCSTSSKPTGAIGKGIFLLIKSDPLRLSARGWRFHPTEVEAGGCPVDRCCPLEWIGPKDRVLGPCHHKEKGSVLYLHHPSLLGKVLLLCLQVNHLLQGLDPVLAPLLVPDRASRAAPFLVARSC